MKIASQFFVNTLNRVGTSITATSCVVSALLPVQESVAVQSYDGFV